MVDSDIIWTQALDTFRSIISSYTESFNDSDYDDATLSPGLEWFEG